MDAAMIRHRTVEANGIAMHVAEAGDEGSPRVVVFLHGFPELWYSWRHQMEHLAARGYRCVAPDLRGYGATDAPPDVASYSAFHIVGDVVALLDALGLHKVFVVGHDWGAIIAWYLCLFRADRVTALVNTSVAFMRHVFIRAGAGAVKPIDYFNRTYGPTYYICRFQMAGCTRGAGARGCREGVLSRQRPVPHEADPVQPFHLRGVRRRQAGVDDRRRAAAPVADGGGPGLLRVGVRADGVHGRHQLLPQHGPELGAGGAVGGRQGAGAHQVRRRRRRPHVPLPGHPGLHPQGRVQGRRPAARGRRRHPRRRPLHPAGEGRRGQRAHPRLHLQVLMPRQCIIYT
uniref:AB hydrolase-1 domain-containing protein n=1 Tax=Setaria italica TaxID=4555 RepID=K4AC49_SETIT